MKQRSKIDGIFKTDIKSNSNRTGSETLSSSRLIDMLDDRTIEHSEENNLTPFQRVESIEVHISGASKFIIRKVIKNGIISDGILIDSKVQKKGGRK